MPGQDPDASARLVLDVLPDLVPLPELPGRGAGSAWPGRAAALLPELSLELGPDGWVLAPHGGRDAARALLALAADVDAFALAAHGLTAAVKVQVPGPLSLAATVFDRRGHRAVADAGLRRDLAQSLAEGAVAHAADLRRRCANAAVVVVQLDEPALPAVLAGSLPTPSGLGRVPAVAEAEARQLLAEVVESLHAAAPDTGVVVHCCAAAVPVGLLVESGFAALSFDLDRVATEDLEAFAAAVDVGAQLWPGAVHPLSPEERTGPVLDRLVRWWRALGFDVETMRARTVVTPTCGLAEAGHEAARAALVRAVDVGRAVGAAD